MENPSLDEIAAAANFSKFHFHRLLQAHVGETVLEFTRRLRLEKAAAQLFYDRDKDITSIALDCGFSSSQNFAKAFKKHFGMSPSEYRDRGTYLVAKTQSKNGNTLRNFGNTDGNPGNATAPSIDHSPSRSTESEAEGKDRVMSIDVKDLDAFKVAYVRVVGEYKHENIRPGFEKLIQWAKPRGLMEGQPCLGLAWDDPNITPAEKCRYDACITIPDDLDVDGDVQTQTVPAGRYAVCRHEAFNNNFQKGWDELLKNWLPSSGYQPANGPSYEVVIESGAHDPQGRWLVDIHLPVKPL